MFSFILYLPCYKILFVAAGYNSCFGVLHSLVWTVAQYFYFLKSTVIPCLEDTFSLLSQLSGLWEGDTFSFILHCSVHFILRWPSGTHLLLTSDMHKLSWASWLVTILSKESSKMASISGRAHSQNPAAWQSNIFAKVHLPQHSATSMYFLFSKETWKREVSDPQHI